VKASVSVEDGHLVWQDGPLAKAQLFEEPATRFFLKVADAQTEFAKDGTGAITGLTLHLPQGDLKAERK